MFQGDDIGLVYTDEMAGRKGFFQFVHSLVGHQCVIRRIDLQVIPHSLDVNDLGEIDPEELTVRPDEDMVIRIKVSLFSGCCE
jgi:hypothetical protein